MNKTEFLELYGDFYWDIDTKYFIKTRLGNFILTISYNPDKKHTIKKTNDSLKLWSVNNTNFSVGIIKIKDVLIANEFEFK
jgi:hypothetical protein